MSHLNDEAVFGLHAFMCESGAGDVLDGRFELREPLGTGGMGVVYAGWDRQSGREVAIKIMRAEAVQQACGDDERGDTVASDEHKRFAREAAALAAVAHPAIVAYVAEGTHDGAPYFVMDRLVGCTLAERLERGPLSVAAAIQIGRLIAEALCAVHREGLAHRDVKPSNIFLIDAETADVRLLDFGIARPAAGPRITRTGALVGTPGYMAPEQVRGERVVEPRVDVFALGCVLSEALSGKPVFQGESLQALLAKILLESPQSLRVGRPAVPIALDTLIDRMLAKEAQSRPQAMEVVAELCALQASMSAASADTLAAMAPAMRLPIVFAEGAVIGGKYRVERAIGEGGMGIVVAARHLELGKRVALKMLHGEHGPSDARVLREAQAAARVESEHVARVLDVGRTDAGTPYIVMEYLSGVDLARHLEMHGPLPVQVAVSYVLEACHALAEAHALGIVHRDIKPSNLFLASRRDGSKLIKVLDFGISKVTRGVDDTSLIHSRSGARDHDSAGIGVVLTGASSVIGSAAYMSPEQLCNSKYVDQRSDIWALGVVLHELLTGRRPFDGESAAVIGARISADAAPRLRDAVKSAPPELEAIILRCLEKTQAKRFPDVSALARSLKPFGEPPRAPLRDDAASSRRAGADAHLAPRVDRGRAKAAPAPVLAVAVLVVGAFGATYLLGQRHYASQAGRATTAPPIATVATKSKPPDDSAADDAATWATWTRIPRSAMPAPGDPVLPKAVLPAGPPAAHGVGATAPLGKARRAAPSAERAGAPPKPAVRYADLLDPSLERR